MTENKTDGCGSYSAEFDETAVEGEILIADLLQKPFDRHIGNFEIPSSLKGFLDVDEINAVITWYLHWKLTYPPNTQNTCFLRDYFGYNEGTRVIVAINLFKYLRGKKYDPQVVEKIISKQ